MEFLLCHFSVKVLPGSKIRLRENYRFYVPFAALEKSREAIINIFGEDEEIMRALNEFYPAQD